MTTQRHDYEDLGDVELSPEQEAKAEAAILLAETQLKAKIKLEFGLPLPEGVENPKAVWGARAITDNSGTIDLLQDRQSTWGPSHETKRLVDLLNANTETIKVNYKKNLNTGKMSMTESSRVELLTDSNNKFHVQANTNSSHGYLYLVAWTE